MGRIIVVAALITLAVVGAAWIGTLTEKVQKRLGRPAPRKAPATRAARVRNVFIGIAILLALILAGFLIQSPSGS
ncbi:hypothetical protein [Zavarzinia aquatilis]|uniref:Uncharacterized protein n=1 Tax=Zavarzinia aquatilis TaxID=2211142 RepID=A0A317ECM0_9PROT|nr:hypothetical protein [Zavarzinia aquatilis]PWR22955.1 hypothetical protein DKG74_11110 [Zavarzinia aquatilis]